jgi:hypothetical protein
VERARVRRRQRRGHAADVAQRSSDVTSGSWRSITIAAGGSTDERMPCSARGGRTRVPRTSPSAPRGRPA